MHKIVSLFRRDYQGDRLVVDEVMPGAEWVPAGEGTPTRKFDGTCCLVRAGRLFKRFSCREGKRLPEGFELEERTEQKDLRGHDVVKLYGWVPVGEGPQDKYHREGWTVTLAASAGAIGEGTYELCGPMVQGNPEGLSEHQLVRHGSVVLEAVPRTFEEIKGWFRGKNVEGIVWHHPDGRMVKIKKKDFGLSRKE